MKTFWAVTTYKPTGRMYRYEYRDSWGKRYYSFDGDNFFSSKKEAFHEALSKDRLTMVNADGTRI